MGCSPRQQEGSPSWLAGPRGCADDGCNVIRDRDLETFTPGRSYRRPRVVQLPCAAWVAARAFATLDPGGTRRIVGWCWAAVRCPAACLELLLLARMGALFVAPAAGRPCAVLVAQTSGFASAVPWPRRPLLVGTPVVLLLAAAMLIWSGIPLLVAMPLCLVLAALYGRVLLQVRHETRAAKQFTGPKPAVPAGTVMLSALAAWPPGTGRGFRLFADMVADLEAQLPAGTLLILEPGEPGLAPRYAELGFEQFPASHWMVRAVPPRVN